MKAVSVFRSALIFLLFPIISLFSQSEYVWVKSISTGAFDEPWAIQQTNDDGYIITGQTYFGQPIAGDVWLEKIDESGNIVWFKTFGGYTQDYGHDIKQTTDGGYVIVGQTYSFGAGGSDVYLIKADSTGNFQWSRTYGDYANDNGNSIQQTPDGGYIMVGNESNVGSAITNFWVLKTDNLGNVQWEKLFAKGQYNIGYSVQITSDGNYIFAGYTDSETTSYDFWLIKTNTNGDTLWTRKYGGNNADIAYSVFQTSDDGYVLTGSSRSFGNGDYDIWLVKTDSLGNMIWNKVFGGSSDDESRSVIQTVDGGYLITGFTWSFGNGNRDIWIIKTDGNGDTTWTKTIGAHLYDEGRDGIQTSDNGYMILGWTSHFGNNVNLIKLSAEISPVDLNLTISADPTSGNGMFNLDYSITNNELTAQNFDYWITRNGTLNNKIIFQKNISLDPGSAFTRKQIADISDKPNGTYQLSLNVGKFPNSIWKNSIVYYEKTSIENGLTKVRNGNSGKFSNYPNPFNPTTIISYKVLEGKTPGRQFVQLKVFNVLGKEVATLVNEEQSAGNYEVEFNASELSSGIYFYTLRSGETVETGKMLLLR